LQSSDSATDVGNPNVRSVVQATGSRCGSAVADRERRSVVAIPVGGLSTLDDPALAIRILRRSLWRIVNDALHRNEAFLVERASELPMLRVQSAADQQ